MSIYKLPWPWSWNTTIYDTAHDIWWPNNTYSSDNSRFQWTKWAGNIIRDNRTMLLWESQPTIMYMTWAEAKTYCSQLSLWWGDQNWRLPNIRELISLVDYTKDPVNYLIDETKFNISSSFYWSSTTDGWDMNSAFTINFYDATTMGSSKINTSWVICVQ